MFTVFRSGARGISGFFRASINHVQIANLTGITTRGEPLKLKKPFPYWSRSLTDLEALIDITVQRVEQENAKLIVVEGPIASGKSAFMKHIAEEFELLYMEQATMDILYMTCSGFDLRTFDDQLPESVRTYDHKNFLTCPNTTKACVFQHGMLLLKISNYIDALTHILNTGQGVIMERSPFSDFVFLEAMYAEGYITKRYKDYYMKVLETAKPMILRPHVVIYLDVPVAKVQENIKKRNLSYEVNSPVLTTSYLQKLEDGWKNKYLDIARDHSEVLVYDWSEGGDVELIIEDLEKLELDPLVAEEYGLLSDWKTWRRNWRHRRLSFTNDKRTLLKYLDLPAHNVPEITVPTEDIVARRKLYEKAPGFEYQDGYNPMKGDSFFKMLLGIPANMSRTPTYLLQL